MAMRGGMYDANKRKKELQRKKKQEEKKQKRQKNIQSPSQDPEGTDSMNIKPVSDEDTSGEM